MTAFKGQQYVHLESPNPKPVVVASECDLYGHDYEVLTMVQSRDPEKIVCARCGKSWKVER